MRSCSVPELATTWCAPRLSPSIVDAVEIDPSIAEIGRQIHLNKPYDDQRGRVIFADARTFLATSKSRNDLIVFGTHD